MAVMRKEFAKIILTTKGNQVLFYVEPNGDDYTLNQIVSTDVATVNIKLGFTKPDAGKNEANAYEALKKVDVAHADSIEKRLTELLG